MLVFSPLHARAGGASAHCAWWDATDARVAFDLAIDAYIAGM